MDLNKVKDNLKKDFNCILIAIINYSNTQFVKAFETTKTGIYYRYFKILEDDKLEEVQDKVLLSYLKKMNEINDRNNY